MAHEKLDEEELSALLASEISSAVTHDEDELSETRARNLEYYQGKMVDIPPMSGRSRATSRDLSDTIGMMMPAYMRVFTASDQMAVFEPSSDDDDEMAEAATAYCNHIFWKDNHGYQIIYNGAHDSMLHGNGIGKIWWDNTPEKEIKTSYGLDEMQFALLQNDKEVEILAASEGEPVEAMDEMGQPVSIPTMDVKHAKVRLKGKCCIEIVPPEDFLIDSDAITVDNARFTAHRSEKTRSDLIKMGFDRATVEELPSHGVTDWSEVRTAREDERVSFETTTNESEQLVELFECYIRADADGDGESEMLRVYYAGSASAGQILDWEICEDGHPWFDLPCDPVPHRWDSRSISDETTDIQRIKTALTRGVLDNLYASLLPMPEVESDSVLNPEQLANPEFGKPIWKKKGSAPIQWQEVPFVAGEALKAIEYFDGVREMRTGISRSSMALDPDVLQNQTAKAVQETGDTRRSMTELIARHHAEYGWRHMFRKMLQLVIRHQDWARTIRIGKKKHTFDPRYWSASMDVTINVGLGTGSRDRDLAMLQVVGGDQKMLVDYAVGSGLGEVALDMLPKVLNRMRKTAESAGVRDADSFYPDIDDEQLEELKGKLREASSQPDPKVQLEQQKAAAQIESDKAKFQADMQLKQLEMQANAQRQQQDLEIQRFKVEQDAQIRREQISAEMSLKREQLAAELQLKKEQMEAELALKREMGMVDGFAKASAALSSDVRPGGEPG